MRQHLAPLASPTRRRLLAAGGLTGLLSACGGSTGSIYQPFKPTRFIAFGDGFTDMGQVNGRRYTVNDGTVNNWAQLVATNYALPLETAANGGLNYAQGNARVTDTPDAVGNPRTPTIAQQITQFLNYSTFQDGDLVLLNGGYSDLIAGLPSAIAASGNKGVYVETAGAAGKALAQQVRRLVNAGATKVVVLGLYNLGRSPWATKVNQAALLTDASGKFNDQLLVNMVDLGTNVLYVDVAYYMNLLTNLPASYGLVDATTLACTSVDVGVGIGVGVGEVNSALCDTTTVDSAIPYSRLLFADPVYPTPQGQTLIGNYVYSRVRTRW